MKILFFSSFTQTEKRAFGETPSLLYSDLPLILSHLSKIIGLGSEARLIGILSSLLFVFLISTGRTQTTNAVTSGGTIGSGTTAIITNPATAITGAITNNGTLQFWQSTSLSNSSVISGTGALSQSGSGTTILSAANTYSGNTTIAAGTLSIGIVS